MTFAPPPIITDDSQRKAVCEVVAIEKVARRYIPDLEPFGGGGWYTGDCPLEDNKDQSFYIAPGGTWQCEGCGRGGDVVDLELLCGNYGSPSEAVLALAIEYDVELPRERNGHHPAFLKFRTAKEVAEATPKEIPWSARPWLARGAITEIDGPIKRAGKTTFVSHMVGRILDGLPFMGEPTAKSRVVYLTEQSPTSFRKVLERAGLTEREDLLVLHWHDTIGAEWPAVAKTTADKAMEFGADVLVVDTLGQFAGIRGDSENSAGAAQEAMQPLQEAAAKGLAVVITRHERKGGGEVGESARGSSAFGGAVDVIMSVRRHQGEGHPTVRIIESLSRFDETPDKLVVELTEDGYRSRGDASAFAEREALTAIGELLLAKEENAMTTAEVLDKLKEHDVKRTVATEALAKLTSVGTIRRVGKGQRGSPYRYYKPLSEDEKDSSALKDGVPDERKNGHHLTAAREEEVAHILSSGTSTHIADERNGELPGSTKAPLTTEQVEVYKRARASGKSEAEARSIARAGGGR
jgi:hypothetical protein